jgi:hypothetical protein
MNNTSHEPYLEQALAEHRQVHRAISELERRLACPVEGDEAAQFEAAIAALRRLAALLREHFAREEEGGYLEEAVSCAPCIARQAVRLQRQHGQFVQLVDRILDRATRAKPCRKAWVQLAHDFGRLARRIDAHEAAENQILAKAFNVAIG